MLLHVEDQSGLILTFFSPHTQKIHKVEIPEFQNKLMCGVFEDWLIAFEGPTREIHLVKPVSRIQLKLPLVIPNALKEDLQRNIYLHCDTRFKIAMSSRPSLNTDYYKIMCINNEQKKISHFNYGSQKWNSMHNSGDGYHDTIYYNGKFYIVDCSGKSSSNPSPTLEELNRVDILLDGWVHICVGSEEMPNRDEIQCRGSLDKVLLKWELGFTPLDFVMLTGLKFGIDRELPYDKRYSKLEKAEKMLSGITSTDIRYGNITLAYFKMWKEPLNPRLNNYDPQMDIVYARAFIAYMMGNLFFLNGSTSLRAGYLAALTDYDIIGTSSFDWGTPIMTTLYRGLDEVSVLKDGKVKKSITGFYVMLELWFFEYCRVGMYLVKVQNFNHIYPRVHLLIIWMSCGINPKECGMRYMKTRDNTLTARTS
ncbi:hypothetical protein GIB67_036084 [Kingdonia uniflora]|uniref:KIB1-4 beta-propeller domain-containing protein n=1 Tax=Kingdonia uniflora TaxID=39325 RepID=A0A7J7N9C3_9MAGN|nr:hypothetical protein GIB67_036084 [Kingdonia uniflora]